MKKLFTTTFGQGPNLVLLHGWGMHSGIWQFIGEKLANEFTVTLIDLPGCGQSEMISDYSIEGIVNELVTIAPKRAIWLGWSLGGLIATKVALSFPDNVIKLICVASTPKFLKSKDWPGMEPAVLKKFYEQLTIDYQKTLKHFLLLQCYGSTISKEKLHWLDKNLFLHGSPDMDALTAGLDILKNEDLRNQLSQLQCPMLYMFGRLDTIVPHSVADVIQKYNQQIRSVVFSKASHTPFISDEEDFLAAVRSFSNA